jgi:hypothetical protein
MGGALAAIERRLRGAPLFARRPLRRLTNVRITGSTASVRRFRPGLDDTVAHGGSLTSEARLPSGSSGEERENGTTKTNNHLS